MSEGASHAVPDHKHTVSLKNGILIMILVIASVVAWMYFGGIYFAIKSNFATFLLLWYWANVEGASFSRMPATVIGALVGVGLALTLRYLPTVSPQFGLWAALAIIIIAVFVQIMNWLPIAINASAMLYLTVMAAPSILMQIDILEMAKAVVVGAIFFMGVVKIAHLYSRLEKRLGFG